MAALICLIQFIDKLRNSMSAPQNQDKICILLMININIKIKYCNIPKDFVEMFLKYHHIFSSLVDIVMRKNRPQTFSQNITEVESLAPLGQ